MRVTRFFLIAPMILVMGGCDDARETLGFVNIPPDEFSIAPNEPLEIPEDLTELAPPEPGKHRPQETPQRDKAYGALFKGKSIPKAAQVSDIEAVVLDQSGATQAPGNIRTLIDEDLEQERATNPIESSLRHFHRRSEHLKPDKELERLGLKKKDSDDTPQS